MNAYNNCTLIGRIPTHEAFKITFVEGTETKRARYAATLAVKRSTKRKDEQYYPEDLVRITAWGPQADYFNKYVKRGDMVAITGSITVDTVERDGVKTSYTGVTVDSVRSINTGNNNGNGNRSTANTALATEEQAPEFEDNPFHKEGQNSVTKSSQPVAQQRSNDDEREEETFNPFGNKNK